MKRGSVLAANGAGEPPHALDSLRASRFLFNEAGFGASSNLAGKLYSVTRSQEKRVYS